MDGGPWAPWIPSKQNTHAPAANEAEDSGVVAIPHLSRDLIACYDGNGSNFGTHPQNVLRGMIYDTETWEFPYLYNLIDQFRYQAKFNNGYAYNMMFVGPGWMNKMGRWEAPYELLLKSYEEGCAYYGKLKKEGKLIDMTMSEFADFYRQKKSYTEPECALWRDILYGSKKQVFWYCDPYMRVGVNMDQGGAIVDLRPYAAKLNWPVGTARRISRMRAIRFSSRKSTVRATSHIMPARAPCAAQKICHNGEEVDLCLCRTKAHFSQEGKNRVLTLDPVDIEFADLTVKLQTVMTFIEAAGTIKIERRVLEMSDPTAEVTINEYMVGCYGTTEYTEDMSSPDAGGRKGRGKKKRLLTSISAARFPWRRPRSVSCTLPPIDTVVSMNCEGREKEGYFKEGYAFSPMFTIGYNGKLADKEVFTTWLNLEKAN